MTEPLISLPDNKGSQLKFRVDSIRSIHFDNEHENGELVDIYVRDKMLVFCGRNVSIAHLNSIMLNFGRPKGYGQVLWQHNSKVYQVIWTPHIGDEGYFNDT